MTDYINDPETGEAYKGIRKSEAPTWGGWRYIDRAKLTMVKPGPYGSMEYARWAHYLDKLLNEMPALQSLVTAYKEKGQPHGHD